MEPSSGSMEKKALGLLKEKIKKKMYSCHASAVRSANMKFLSDEGEKLEFTLEETEKGPAAVNLKKID